MKIPVDIIPLSGRGRDPNLPFDFDLVFYRLRNRQYARADVIPADPRSPAQLRLRDIMRAVSPAYGTVTTEEQRRAWRAVAEKQWSRRHLTRGPLTGQDLFVKLNTVLRLVGREMLLWPPEPVAFGPNPVEKLRIRRRHGRLSLKLRLAGPVPDDIMVYGQAPCRAGRKKPRHPVYLGLLPPPVGGSSDITAQYVARFGEPEPGQRVIIRVRQQRNGWQDEARDVSQVVPARVLAASRNTPGSAPRHPRNARKALGAGLGFNGLPGLNQLHSLLGLPGFQPHRHSAFFLLPSSFFLPPLSESPRHRPPPAAFRRHSRSTPMCTAQLADITPLANQPWTRSALDPSGPLLNPLSPVPQSHKGRI